MPVYNYTTLDDPLSHPFPLGTLFTQPFGINDAGQIVGVYRAANVFHGFLLSGGTYTTVDDPSASGTGLGTFAQGINDAGQIVGHYDDGRTERGFLLSGGTYSTIDHTGFVFGTQLFAINALG